MAARLQALENGEALFTHEDVTALIEKRLGREKRKIRDLEAQLYESEAEVESLELRVESLKRELEALS